MYTVVHIIKTCSFTSVTYGTRPLRLIVTVG